MRTVEKNVNNQRVTGFQAPDIVLLILSGIAAGVFSQIAGAGTDVTVRNTVSALLAASVMVFLLGSERIQGRLLFDNAHHPERFCIAYTASLLAALFLTRVDTALWPYPVIFTVLALTGNALTGMYAGAVLLFLSVLFLPAQGTAVFACYFLAGSVCVVWFSAVDEKMRVVQAAFGCALVQAICLLAFQVLMVNARFHVSMLWIPLINTAGCALLLAVIAHIFIGTVVRHDRVRYADINDTEFSLMAAIRTRDKDAYYRAIHTSYLVDKVAEALHLKKDAARACAAYHRIGCLDGKKSVWPDVAHYYTEFDFPEDAVALIREYLTFSRSGPSSREATAVFVCECLVDRLLMIFRKNKNASVAYDTLIDETVAQLRTEGSLSRSEMSIGEIEQLKNVLKQEKLYYDLLR